MSYNRRLDNIIEKQSGTPFALKEFVSIRDPALLDAVDECTNSLQSRVEWKPPSAPVANTDAWCIINPELQLDRIYVPRRILSQMKANDGTGDMFDPCQQLTESQIAAALSKDDTDRDIRTHVANFIRDIDQKARVVHAAEKILWLESHPHPLNKPRMYFPLFYHVHNRVKSSDVSCMECMAKPTPCSTSIRKAVWQVLHISDPRVLYRAKTPDPTASDQFFLCPACNNSHQLADEVSDLSFTAMWIVESKEWHQPHWHGINGSIINRNWIAHVPNIRQRRSKRSKTA